ncbi:interleukin-18-binding protein [Ochotona curzoniae]|uniref:interleukin-18-binding protein n=1 Tax=Ochotona curzoniae TaxID=130825 RepID=UPI001B348E74|nr:interleukin-18-binding protein [Ochotona curzoniae]
MHHGCETELDRRSSNLGVSRQRTGRHRLTSFFADSRPLGVLLLCSQTLTLLAAAAPTPQNAAAITGSAGISQDSTPPVFPVAKQCPALEVTWPEVEVPLNGMLALSCVACSHIPAFHALYWLGNGSFIEHLPGRLWEGSTSRYHRPTGTWLQRALVLEELTTALRNTNFTCVSVDTEQVALYHVIPAQLWIIPPSSQTPEPQLPVTAGSGFSSTIARP